MTSSRRNRASKRCEARHTLGIVSAKRSNGLESHAMGIGRGMGGWVHEGFQEKWRAKGYET